VNEEKGLGLPTLTDILIELARPGRDPRKEFKTASFNENIKEIKDLKEGMIVEGNVTNVANFGAFVDIGVHQDGLVHISELAHKFVKDPHEVIRVGDIVKVKVLAVDKEQKRVSLSIKQTQAEPQVIQKQQVYQKPQKKQERILNIKDLLSLNQKYG
jgi:uncharacterized protein